MDKNVIKQIIIRQQEFVSKIKLQKRNIQLDPSANYVLVGIRRAGKSFLLYQYIQDLLEQGHLMEEILFFNFEDERISDIKKNELNLILECYSELYAHEPIIFLDEIQNIDGWEHFARRLADEKRRVLITGSNAHMLSREISSVLGGRYIPKEIYPFSLTEFLQFNGVVLSRNWEFSSTKSTVVRLFAEFFYNGGLSEMFELQDKKSWLQSLYHKILFSDIVVRKGIRNEQSLKLLIRKLADGVMQPVSIKRLQNILQGDGTKIARETVSNYLEYLNEAYLTFSVSNFSDSIVERESQKKYYFFDNGILNLFLYQPDTKLLENIVALELHKKYGDNLFYYNKNIEVDFCVPDDGLLVQVSYDMKTDETRKREFGALVKAAKFFKAKKLLVITYNQEEETEYDGSKISVIPVWKFLIENE